MSSMPPPPDQPEGQPESPGYPPPPAGSGGYPPPPPGGYPPPPPTDGGGYAGYGGYGGGPQPYSISAAFNWGWKKFQENVSTILIAALVYFVVLAVLEVVFFVITGGLGGGATVDSDGTIHGGRGFFAQLLISALFGVVFYAITSIMQAGILRGATEITYGRKPEVSRMLSTENLANVLITGLLIGVLSGIGFILCIIPGIIVIFYSQFTMFFVVERKMSPVDALSASFGLVNKNLGTLVGFFFASLAAYIVGAILCGIGLLLAIPVVILAQAYTYRSLQGEAVAP